MSCLGADDDDVTLRLSGGGWATGAEAASAAHAAAATRWNLAMPNLERVVVCVCVVVCVGCVRGVCVWLKLCVH